MSVVNSGYTRSTLLQSGTLIQLQRDIIGFVPYVTVFQYNPETIKRSFDVQGPGLAEEGVEKMQPPFDRAFPPGETWSFNLQLDATDDLEIGRPLALTMGVADRLAALERMIFPTDGLLNDISNNNISFVLGEPTKSTVPIVLLCLGPRVVPVWISSLSITESFHNLAMMPLHAEVDLAFRVLTAPELSLAPTMVPPPDLLIARAILKLHTLQRNALALANAESVMSDQIHHLGLF